MPSILPINHRRKTFYIWLFLFSFQNVNATDTYICKLERSFSSTGNGVVEDTDHRIKRGFKHIELKISPITIKIKSRRNKFELDYQTIHIQEDIIWGRQEPDYNHENQLLIFNRILGKLNLAFISSYVISNAFFYCNMS